MPDSVALMRPNKRPRSPFGTASLPIPKSASGGRFSPSAIRSAVSNDGSGYPAFDLTDCLHRQVDTLRENFLRHALCAPVMTDARSECLFEFHPRLRWLMFGGQRSDFEESEPLLLAKEMQYILFREIRCTDTDLTTCSMLTSSRPLPNGPSSR
jgi:hypothetical protein